MIWSKRPLEVRADAVHLVDEADARHAVLVGLAPDGLRLRLDAGDRVEHGDRAVEHAQRALDFGGEVDVARRVDDVDAVIAPEAGGRGGRDRDAALLLLLHPVHDGGAFVDLADLVRDPGVEQDPFGRGRLAGIDVGHDADVPRLVLVMLAWPLLEFSVEFSVGSQALSSSCSSPSTSDSARTPCSLPPSGACLRASSRRRRAGSPRRAARWPASPASSCRRRARARSRRASGC